MIKNIDVILNENFIKHFGNDQNANISYCPYRICPLGAHVDHQHGLVSGFAIDKGVYLKYTATSNGSIELYSHNKSGGVAFNISDNLKKVEKEWGNYIKGAVHVLKQKYDLKFGINGYICGEMPSGGLSTSAALLLCFLNAICKVNNLVLTKRELIDFAFLAETTFVGINVGKLDQSCEVLSKENCLLFLDTKTDEYEIVPHPKKMKKFEFLVIYSGVERKLESSPFNNRVEECKAASYALKAFAKKDYNDVKESRLRDVDIKTFGKYKNKLPLNWRKRATHFYGECERVKLGIEAWRNGDIDTFGKLVFESGKSSIENYESGSRPLISIYNLMVNCDGVLGGRFLGGGFNGCCMAIIEPSKRKQIIKFIQEGYLKEYPEYKDTFFIVPCKSKDGMGE